jgi:hypothetical protein
VKAHLLDCVEHVRHGEDEVLESSDHAAIGSQVADRATCVGDLGLRVHRCGAGHAVPHASMLNDIPSVLVLVEEEVIMLHLRGDAQEVVERTQVFHGELPLESCSGIL